MKYTTNRNKSHLNRDDRKQAAKARSNRKTANALKRLIGSM